MRPDVLKKRSGKTGLSQVQATVLTDLTWKLGEPLCVGEGMELVHVECRPASRGHVLRLYIDKPGGVTLDDCVNISRQIGDLLDVHMDDEAAYTLEVSSPGPDRPLTKPEDFNRFSGHRARIRTVETIDEQHNFTGILAGMHDKIVTLQVNERSINIPFSKIKHACLIEYQGEN